MPRQTHTHPEEGLSGDQFLCYCIICVGRGRHATEGEIMNALADVFGRYVEVARI